MVEVEPVLFVPAVRPARAPGAGVLLGEVERWPPERRWIRPRRCRAARTRVRIRAPTAWSAARWRGTRRGTRRCRNPPARIPTTSRSARSCRSGPSVRSRSRRVPGTAGCPRPSDAGEAGSSTPPGRTSPRCSRRSTVADGIPIMRRSSRPSALKSAVVWAMPKPCGSASHARVTSWKRPRPSFWYTSSPAKSLATTRSRSCVRVQIHERRAVGAAMAFGGEPGGDRRVRERPAPVVQQQVGGEAVVGVVIGRLQDRPQRRHPVLAQEHVEVAVAVHVPAGQGHRILQRDGCAPDPDFGRAESAGPWTAPGRAQAPRRPPPTDRPCRRC